jgi:glycosyltransferase involved in cell wall biosynthesis
MAAGLPILLSKKINAATALLEEGGNGFSFDPNDRVDIADKILRFINLDESTKKAMSDRSLQIINTMNYENMGIELLTVLNKMTVQKHKKATFLGWFFMGLWRGRYNTSGWNK